MIVWVVWLWLEARAFFFTDIFAGFSHRYRMLIAMFNKRVLLFSPKSDSPVQDPVEAYQAIN